MTNLADEQRDKYEQALRYFGFNPETFKPKEHEHHFNIPVEWAYIPEQTSMMQSNDDYSTRFVDLDKPFKRVVTKLKCTGCNEEQDR